MWITNGGFADVFIVFAKVDGEQFSAFIVERGFPGVTIGKEEHKMGLLGSSTTAILLPDAEVPAANLLGEIGKGHKIAFNVLNYGRFKLAGMCTGSARGALAEAARYAATRRQFGQPIATFGAIRHKLAEMTVRLYGVESALYRVAGLIDAAIGAAGDGPDALAGAFEEFAVEASLLKVAGSEMVGYVVDENVQVHGGNGFVRDYPAERHYRDARVNRIFEGTNEINRILAPTLLIRRGVKGAVPLLAAARALQDEVPGPAAAVGDAASRTVAGMKKTSILLLGLAMQTYGETLAREQEVLMLVSDALVDTLVADSAALRALASGGDALHADVAAVLAHDGAVRVEATARTAIAAMTSGDSLRTTLAALGRLLTIEPANTVAVRRRIADRVVDGKGYPFGPR